MGCVYVNNKYTVQALACVFYFKLAYNIQTFFTECGFVAVGYDLVGIVDLIEMIVYITKINDKTKSKLSSLIHCSFTDTCK